MKTDEWVAILARQVAPVAVPQPDRVLAGVVLVGGTLALSLMAVVLGFNPALDAYLHLPMFWVKLGFGVALAAAGWALARVAGLPGVRLPRAALLAAAVPFVLLALLAAVALASAAPGESTALLAGRTWRVCSLRILVLSVPVLVPAMAMLRRLAPTRPAAAGAAAGLLAGGVGTVVYALHCPELAAPFLATWYALGVLLASAGGAVLGARLLRW